MAKTIFTLLIILTGFNTLNCKRPMNHAQEFEEIYYEASSRGYFLSISINPEDLKIIKERGGDVVTSVLNENERDELHTVLNQIDLKTLSDLEAPSTKSTFDGAHMAFLRVSVPEQAFESQIFDHGNPPKKIEPLVRLILNLANVD
ncbi:MAG: hypothetical protein HKN00_01900 [Flavobacteriaceae bacterium]|nr:hypothetical protein [Bacteroidia bacterium]MBT8287115.1 hypothetical protein [Bacteroidia bacterium]NNF73907.1 hypothetical protein [Flavobacteriaceae bacterium]NNK71867.1 hypothetical protein [Flavobacteriaceae bacterium]